MQVAIIGAGSMGRGIAQVSALAGHDVVLRDIDDEIVAEGLEHIRKTLRDSVEGGHVSDEESAAALDRIEGTTALSAAVADADLVVEAVPESLELKQEIFTDVEGEADSDCVIGSNTSSLSVSEIASVLDRPERAIGLHFFNPPHIMNLVEVVVGERTSAGTKSVATSFVDGLGKETVVVNDTAGFASSRLGIALGLEAIRMVERGVADPADIDTAMREGYNHPMGPLKLTDYVGLDVRLDIATALREELGERFKPPQLLKRKVRGGNLGKKSGEGFYVWEDGEAVRPADRGENR